MTTPTPSRRVSASTAVLGVLLVVAVLLAVALGAGWIRFGNKPAEAQAPAAATSPAKPATTGSVDLRAELATFIAKRGAEQGKEAGALLMTAGIKDVAKNGTEWAVTAEFDALLVAAEAPKQVAYMIGKYDSTATKVTVKTPGGQELFSGPPPAQPISSGS